MGQLPGCDRRFAHAAVLVCAAFMLATSGCGSTKQRIATDQLLLSSAVDEAIGEIDFSPLAGQRVYFDTEYIKDSKSNRLEVGDAASGYVISALRQQIAAAGCLLQEDAAAADFVIEGRVGALGSDESEVVYGIPASNIFGAAATAASAVTAVPNVPTIPEIALARKDNRRAAAKIVAYAYHRESREIVWQSGQSQAEATAEDRWVMGAGPFQKGTIYDGVQFAGTDLELPSNAPSDGVRISIADSGNAHIFRDPQSFNEPPENAAAEENTLIAGDDTKSSNEGDAAPGRTSNADPEVIPAGHSVERR